MLERNKFELLLWIRGKLNNSFFMENTLEQERNCYFTQMNEIEKKSVLLLLKTFLKERTSKKNSLILKNTIRKLMRRWQKIESGNYIIKGEMENLSSKW